jgi:uncharacterized membrane protein YhhN
MSYNSNVQNVTIGVTIFLVVLVVMAAISGGVSYDKYKETEQMKVCVAAGKSWQFNDDSNRMECR